MLAPNITAAEPEAGGITPHRTYSDVVLANVNKPAQPQPTPETPAQALYTPVRPAQSVYPTEAMFYDPNNHNDFTSFTRLSLDDVHIDADFECCDVTFSPFQHDYDPLFDDTPQSIDWRDDSSQWPGARTCSWPADRAVNAYDEFVSLLYKQRRLDLNCSSPGYGFDMQGDPLQANIAQTGSFAHLLQKMATTTAASRGMPEEGGLWNLTQKVRVDGKAPGAPVAGAGASFQNTVDMASTFGHLCQPEMSSIGTMTQSQLLNDFETPKMHRTTACRGRKLHHGNELNGLTRASKPRLPPPQQQQQQQQLQYTNNSNNFAEAQCSFGMSETGCDATTITTNDLNKVSTCDVSGGARAESMNVLRAQGGTESGGEHLSLEPACVTCGEPYACRCDPLLESLRSLQLEPTLAPRRPYFATASPGGACVSGRSPAKNAATRTQFVELDRQVAQWSRWRSQAEEMLSMLPPLMTQARDVYIAKYSRFKIGSGFVISTYRQLHTVKLRKV